MPEYSDWSASRKPMTARLSSPASMRGVSMFSSASSASMVSISKAFSMTVARTLAGSSFGRLAMLWVGSWATTSASSSAAGWSEKMPMANASPAASPLSRKMAAAAFAASVAPWRSPAIMLASALTTSALASALASPTWWKMSTASSAAFTAAGASWALAQTCANVCSATARGNLAPSFRKNATESCALFTAVACRRATSFQCFLSSGLGSLTSRTSSSWSMCARSRRASASPAVSLIR
mmetsp:Transcript_29448/g.91796  ORF Transcript_29448/g.91796 Transcript_29448/m.91796 type:complete len:239 (-) Transcript_29448:1604-2320(-)